MAENSKQGMGYKDIVKENALLEKYYKVLNCLCVFLYSKRYFMVT